MGKDNLKWTARSIAEHMPSYQSWRNMKHNRELRDMAGDEAAQGSREMTREEAQSQLEESLFGDNNPDDSRKNMAHALFATLDIVDELRQEVQDLRATVQGQGQRIAQHTHDVSGRAALAIAGQGHSRDMGHGGVLERMVDREPRAPQGWHRLLK